MKSRFLFVFLIYCCAQIFWGGEVLGQCDQVVVNAPNYSVIVNVSLKKIAILNNGCPYGYNWGVEVEYETTFTGNPPPGLVLDNLAVTVVCTGVNIGPFNLNQTPGTHTSIQGNAYSSNCNPFPPAIEDRGCNSIRIIVSESNGTGPGNDISNIIVTTPCKSIPTPVDYLYFKTSLTASGFPHLNWSTTKEWENSHFEIERSINSINEWEKIECIQGASYSDTPVEYSFTDSDLPKSGGNIFYRLKQVDFSGKYSYSKTRAIQVDAKDSKTAWIASPNPSTIGSDVSIDLLQLQEYQDEQISLRLVNMLGEGSSTILNSPYAISPLVSEWLRSKKAGLYILDIRWGANSQQLKLLRN